VIGLLYFNAILNTSDFYSLIYGVGIYTPGNKHILICSGATDCAELDRVSNQTPCIWTVCACSSCEAETLKSVNVTGKVVLCGAPPRLRFLDAGSRVAKAGAKWPHLQHQPPQHGRMPCVLVDLELARRIWLYIDACSYHHIAWRVLIKDFSGHLPSLLFVREVIWRVYIT
jgi:hypothetical protein